MFALREVMKKRTDQLIKCMEGVIAPIDRLADELHTLNKQLKEGKNPDSKTLKSLEKVGRTVGKEVENLQRSVDAHKKSMEKMSEALIG